MLLDHSKFVVKSKGKLLSSKKSFEILDEAGQVIGTAKDVTGLIASVMGGCAIDVYEGTGTEKAFTVSRSGLLMKKDQVIGPDGVVVGRYKAKLMSLSGGFHVYDKDGKHLAEIKGKMFKAEYKFLTPEGKEEMGSVSRKWGGLAQSLLTDNDTYGVQMAPAFADDKTAKILILAATIAVESIFKKGDEGGGGDDD